MEKEVGDTPPDTLPALGLPGAAGTGIVCFGATKGCSGLHWNTHWSSREGCEGSDWGFCGSELELAMHLRLWSLTVSDWA